MNLEPEETKAVEGSPQIGVWKEGVGECDTLTVQRDLTEAHYLDTTTGKKVRMRLQHGVVVDGGEFTGLILKVLDGVAEEEIRVAFAEAVKKLPPRMLPYSDKLLRGGLVRNGFGVPARVEGLVPGQSGTVLP